MSKMDYLNKIENHLEKIDRLCAELIKEMLDKISRFNDFNLSASMQFMIDQHVYLEQVAAHLMAIEHHTTQMDMKYFNKYLFRDAFTRGSLVETDVLVAEIIEKVGFISGLEKKGREMLAKHKINASWKTKTIDSSYKIMRRYNKKPILHILFK